MKKVVNCLYETNSYIEMYQPLFDNGFTLDFKNLCHTQEEKAVIGAVTGYNYVIAGSEIWNRHVFENVKSSVRMLVRHGTGMDNVDLEAASDNGITVSNTPGANASAVAELALGMLICLLRRISAFDAGMKRGEWNPTLANSLSGTAGLIGFGAVAREFARILKAFPVDVLVHDIKTDGEAERQYGVKYTSLDELAERSDFISIHVPLSPETAGMVGSGLISKMKGNAIIINTSRGPVVDEDALAGALKAKRIAGAALDVYNAEPLPGDSPLRGLDNVLLTPHVASASVDGQKGMIARCVSNILDFEAGKKFRGLFESTDNRKGVF